MITQKELKLIEIMTCTKFGTRGDLDTPRSVRDPGSESHRATECTVPTKAPRRESLAPTFSEY